MEFNEYEKVIIKDVASGKYQRDKKLVKITFLVISLLFLAIYILGFHNDIIDNLETVLKSYREALITHDYSYKILIFSFNKIMIFMAFMFLLIIFLLFAFFSYDIMSRNRVIDYFQKQSDKLDKNSSLNNADESEDK